MSSEIEIVTIHEAGHCAAYIYFGWRCGRVRIYRDRDGRVRGDVIAPAGRYDPRSRAIMCLTGPLAEEKLTGVSIFDQPGSCHDFEMAREALARVGETLDAVLSEARWLVGYRWSTIELVARALADTGELGWEEIRQFA